MDKRNSEQLLGYVLNALEPGEIHEIEQRLQQDAQLRADLDHLRHTMRPVLNAKSCVANADILVPGNLAQKTCDFIDSVIEGKVDSPGTCSNLSISDSSECSPLPVVSPKSRAIEHSTVADRPQPPEQDHHFRSIRGDTRPLGRSTAWRMADLFTVTGVTAMSLMLVFPAINSSRFNNRIQQCQENMRQVGQHLHDYSDMNGGFFPRIPESGTLSTAGVYAPILRDAGLLENDGSLVCPDSALAEQLHQRKPPETFEVPSYRQIQALPQDSVQLADYRQKMGGSYAYNLGYTEDDKYHHNRNLRRSSYPILADAPLHNGAQLLRTIHHGGRGQNVLFEDGHVRFVSSPTLQTSSHQPDHLYLNDHGVIAAGTHAGDAVLGSSNQAPIRFTSN